MAEAVEDAEELGVPCVPACAPTCAPSPIATKQPRLSRSAASTLLRDALIGSTLLPGVLADCHGARRANTLAAGVFAAPPVVADVTAAAPPDAADAPDVLARSAKTDGKSTTAAAARSHADDDDEGAEEVEVDEEEEVEEDSSGVMRTDGMELCPDCVAQDCASARCGRRTRRSMEKSVASTARMVLLGPVHTTDARCVATRNLASQAQNEAGVGPRRGFATTRAAFLVATRAGMSLPRRSASWHSLPTRPVWAASCAWLCALAGPFALASVV